MTLSIRTRGMKWILYAAALVFALLSCADHSTDHSSASDTTVSNASQGPASSQTDTVNQSMDNSGASVGEGTTTSGTSTGSSSTHKDSIK